MRDEIQAFATIKQLSDHIHERLCQSDRLDPEQTPMTAKRLEKRGQLCGVMFQVEGPRRLLITGIWAADENRILIYDSTGRRQSAIRLSESPELIEPTFQKQAA